MGAKSFVVELISLCVFYGDNQYSNLIPLKKKKEKKEKKKEKKSK